MTEPFAALSSTERALLRRSAPPHRAQPMKAVLTEERFSDPGWIYERKLDGIRCIAIRSARDVRLLSRNNLSLDDRYPELVEALRAASSHDVALDGEIVAFEDGRTSFARLAQRARRPAPIFLYVFDILHLAGSDTTRLPLRARKRLLRSALRFGGRVRFTPHRNERGEALYVQACRRGWEGVIAKRADAPYTAARTRDWLKFKCDRRQELVIGGYTAPRGSRVELGALLVGHFADGELLYAGKVGTGFDTPTLHDLARRLAPLRRSSSPFADAVPERGPTWVRPELVAEVAFTEWTRDGRLRHPRFLGLRDDKAARQVVRES